MFQAHAIRAARVAHHSGFGYRVDRRRKACGGVFGELTIVRSLHPVLIRIRRHFGEKKPQVGKVGTDALLECRYR